MKGLSKSQAEDAYMTAWLADNKHELKRLETVLKKRFGLTDFDITILRKRTEPQPELWEWLSK